MLFILCSFDSSGAYGQAARTGSAGANIPATPAVNPVAASRPAPVLPAQKSNPVSVTRFENAPVIDGLLDDEVWKEAVVLKDFYQISPGDNIAPSKPTEVRLGHDAKVLYIAFRAYDELGRVRATVAKRDDVFGDDYVGIILDTFNDQRRAYELFFNPLGVQADGILTEGRGEDFSIDIVMDSKGVVTSDGYTVEVAIPFKSLRYHTGKDALWGVHFQRSIKRFNDELSSWMPISRERSGTLNQAGHLMGFENLAEGRTLEIIPSLTLSETGRRVRTVLPSALDDDPTLRDNGRFVNQPINLDPGLTLKYGITPNVTLDFAVNPDFAQVEADELVVTANQRFPIFFEEKRPFFLEGIDIFQTPLQAVHTRAIIDPDYAAKLTGKVGRNTFGLLVASDNAPGNFSDEERLVPNNSRFLDKNAHIGVLRLKRDVGAESSIGLIATSYSFIEKHNHLGGIDGQFRLDPKTVFSFQMLGTHSRRHFFDPEQGRNIYRTGNALAYYWNYDKVDRHLNYTFSGSGRTIDYRADVGFTQRRNTNRQDFTVRYNSEPQPKARLVSWRLYNNVNVNYDWQGRMQGWNEAAQFRVNFQRQTVLNFGYSGGYERLLEEEFGRKRTPTRAGRFAGADSERSTYKQSFLAYGSSTPTKKISAAFLVQYIRNAFDFDFGAGLKFPRVSPSALADPEGALGPNSPLDPGPGRELRLELEFNYQPTEALRAELFYTKDRLVRNDTGRVAFDDNIFTMRTTYQFTRFTFARARLDYSSLEASLRGQFLLGWTPNPGTAIYAGYNDDSSYNGFNPFTDHPEPGFRRNSRSFFIKMSYLFRRSL